MPPRDGPNETTDTEAIESDDSASLSPQKPQGSDPNNKIAIAALESAPPPPKPIDRMTLTEFRNMVSGLPSIDGVTSLYVSPDLEVTYKDPKNRKRYTLRESYDHTPQKRRHFLYATFAYNGKFVCLIEIDQTGLSIKVGTYVLISKFRLNMVLALMATEYFTSELNNVDMKTKWLERRVIFNTKSHPAKQAQDLWESWRVRMLEMVSNPEAAQLP